MERIKNYSYESKDLIGAGSMGSVYRARDFLEGREVALKILHASFGLDPELRERFFREGRIAMAMHHPNIAEVYECGESNDLPFFCMELLTGADVRDYIRQKRPLTLAEKVELIAQVCDGLGAAHKVPVVHRDIKPSNIFIHEESASSQRIAKLLDFGIVRIPDSTLTVRGSVLGTPKYMAPEQIAMGQCDARSDLFSLAILLYEFLAYVHPFQGPMVPKRILEEEPDRLRVHNPLVPPALEELVYRGLNKDPAKRFATAQQFGEGLRSFLTDLQLGRTGSAIGVGKPLAAQPAAFDEVVQSAEGKKKAFIGLVRAFERQIASADREAAQGTIERMRELAGGEAAFAQGLQQCEAELVAVLKWEGPAAMVAAAAQGASASGAGQSTVPIVDLTTQGLPVMRSWDDTIGFSRRSEAAGVLPPADAVGVQPAESLPLVCASCATANRDSARFCRQCGATLAPSGPATDANGGSTGDATQIQVVQNEKPAAVRAEQLSGRIVKGGRKVLASALGKTINFVNQVLHLPTPQKLLVAGGLVVAIAVFAVTSSLEVWSPMPPVERSIGTASVTVPETQLSATPDPNGKLLMNLAQGSQLNLLDPFKGLSETYIRVQFVSPKKNSLPGFVRTADLGQWVSSDVGSAWAIVQLARPRQNAGEAEVRAFLEQLRKYRNTFAGTPQSESASLESAKLRISLATLAKNGGKAQVEWQSDVDKAVEDIRWVGSNNGSEVAGLNQQLEELNKQQGAPLPTQVAPGDAEYRTYDAKARYCFNITGDLECVLEQAALIEKTRPAAGQWWRNEVEKILQRARKGRKQK